MKKIDILQGKKEFVVLNETWYILYEWVQNNGLFQYGLRLRYKDTGTYFKYIRPNSVKFLNELDMKKDIKKNIAAWLMQIKKDHNVEKIPVCEVQEIVTPQLKLF